MSDLEVVHSVEAMPAEIDSLVVLGKQYGVGSSRQHVANSPDGLSDDSRMNVIAAGMLWTPERNRLLLSGNKKAGFPNAASEFLAEHFPEIPFASYANPDDESPDTRSSVINVPDILDSEGHTNATLVTVGFHIKRAFGMFSRYDDIISCAAASEDIRAERSKEDEDYVIAWKSLTRIKMERAKEFALRRLDASGKIGQPILKAVRP